MANETLYSDIVNLIPEIWEKALTYAKHQFVLPGLVSVFSDRTGFTPRNISEYIETRNVVQLAETDDLAGTALIRELLATLTPVEYGKQIVLTDARIETDDANVMVDAVEELGYSLGRHMEEALMSDLVNFTGGTIGDGTGDFSLSAVFRARALLQSRGIGGPYYCVVHPFQWLDEFEKFIDLAKPADVAYRTTGINEYMVPAIADVRFISGGLVPRRPVNTITITATSGNYKLNVNGAQTANIAYNANAAAVQTAINTVAGTGFVTVTGTGPLTVTFNKGVYEGVEMSVTDVDLAGGTVVVAETSAKAYSALFTRDALALDLRRGLRIEPDRDASARLTELNATQVYAHGVWRANRGVLINTDASVPA